MFGKNASDNEDVSPSSDTPLQNFQFHSPSKPLSYNFSGGGRAKVIAQQAAGHFFSLTQLPTGLVGGHYIGAIYKYGIHGWSLVYKDDQKFTALTTSGDDTLVVGTESGVFFTYNIHNKTKVDFGTTSLKIIAIAATQSGYIATLDINNRVKIWSSTPHQPCIAEFADCNCITAHRDCFIYQLENQPVQIWDCNTKSNTPTKLQLANDENIFCIASLDSDHIACGNCCGKIYIWNIDENNNRCLNSIGRPAEVRNIAAFPDYAALACLYSDGVIKIWDYKVAKEIETINPHSDPKLNPELLCPLPNGQFAVTKGDIYFDIYNLPHLQTRSWCNIL